MAALFRTALVVATLSLIPALHAEEPAEPTPQVTDRIIKEADSNPIFPSAPVMPMRDIMNRTPEGFAQRAARVIKEKDSREKVLKDAGQPIRIIPATADEEEVWIYSDSMTVLVGFDQWGVKSVTQIFD